MRFRGDEVEKHTTDDRAFAQRESSRESRDVRHDLSLSVQADPALASMLHCRRIGAIEEGREFRRIVGEEEVFDLSRAVQRVDFDYLEVGHGVESGERTRMATTLSRLAETMPVSGSHMSYDSNLRGVWNHGGSGEAGMECEASHHFEVGAGLR